MDSFNFGAQFGDDSAFMIDEIRRAGQRQCQVLKTIKDAGQPFVRFNFEYDFLENFRSVKAGNYSVYDILNNQRAGQELQKVSRGNVLKMDDSNCRISVRMFGDDNTRIYVVDFKKMEVTFNGKVIAHIMGVMVKDDSAEAEIAVDVPLLTPSVVQAYISSM